MIGLVQKSVAIWRRATFIRRTNWSHRQCHDDSAINTNTCIIIIINEMITNWRKCTTTTTTTWSPVGDQPRVRARCPYPSSVWPAPPRLAHLCPSSGCPCMLPWVFPILCDHGWAPIALEAVRWRKCTQLNSGWIRGVLVFHYLS